MSNGDPQDGFFYPTLTLRVDSYVTQAVTRGLSIVFELTHMVVIIMLQ